MSIKHKLTHTHRERERERRRGREREGEREREKEREKDIYIYIIRSFKTEIIHSFKRECTEREKENKIKPRINNKH